MRAGVEAVGEKAGGRRTRRPGEASPRIGIAEKSPRLVHQAREGRDRGGQPGRVEAGRTEREWGRQRPRSRGDQCPTLVPQGPPPRPTPSPRFSPATASRRVHHEPEKARPPARRNRRPSAGGVRPPLPRPGSSIPTGTPGGWGHSSVAAWSAAAQAASRSPSVANPSAYRSATSTAARLRASVIRCIDASASGPRRTSRSLRPVTLSRRNFSIACGSVAASQFPFGHRAPSEVGFPTG